jgi:hypothetical protein
MKGSSLTEPVGNHTGRLLRTSVQASPVRMPSCQGGGGQYACVILSEMVSTAPDQPLLRWKASWRGLEGFIASECMALVSMSVWLCKKEKEVSVVEGLDRVDTGVDACVDTGTRFLAITGVPNTALLVDSVTSEQGPPHTPSVKNPVLLFGSAQGECKEFRKWS